MGMGGFATHFIHSFIAQVRRGVVLWWGVRAFHDAAFTRVGGCDVVRLYDWELRMRKVSCSFFPEEGVVRDMEIRAEMLACWKKPTLVRRCLPTAGCISMRGFFARMPARQTDDGI